MMLLGKPRASAGGSAWSDRALRGCETAARARDVARASWRAASASGSTFPWTQHLDRLGCTLLRIAGFEPNVGREADAADRRSAPRRARRILAQPLTFAALILAVGSAAPAATFEEAVAPVLERRCVMCHGAQAQSGGLRLDTLSPDIVGDRRAGERWRDVLHAVNRGDMPPKGAPELTMDERTALVDWLYGEVRKAAQAWRSTGGQVVMRRLNRIEYQNTMRDLLGVDLDYARNLPPDEMSPDGFRNNGAALRMSALQLEYYLQAARMGLSHAIVEGPAPEVAELRVENTTEDKEKFRHFTERLGRTGEFVARSLEFPDEGEFEIRIRARAEIPDGAAYPRMEVTLGYRADTQTPSRRVGAADVTSAEEEEFVFRGRIESFPRQSRTQSKYPGLLIWVKNVYSDGKPRPEGRKVESTVDGKKVTEWVFEEDPAFPKIVVESLEFRAPVFAAWPPRHHTRILPRTPQSREDEPAAAREALRGFMGRAFRRPVQDAEVETALRYYAKVRPTVASYEQAMRETLAMTLVSPDFLYRVETEELDDYALASRLSYFLWSTMPDPRLRRLAESGGLKDPDRLASEAGRMLADERARAFVEQFSDEWLDLAGVDRIAVNPNYYPDFDPKLKADMRRESQQFFGEVLRRDLSALGFLRADFAMLNEPLARHYGVSGPKGSAFERVPREQGGLLTQASVLLANSTGEDSHPIERGVWVRSVLLGDPPPPPPPAVPNLDNGETDLSLLPLRRQLELHRDNAACAQCHQGIDPWGIALEEYDAIGLKREEIVRRAGEREARHPVEAATTLPDGSEVNGAAELADYLVERRSRQFARALTSKLLTYALGRSLELTDEPAVDELTKKFEESRYRLRSLVTLIVASEPFRSP